MLDRVLAPLRPEDDAADRSVPLTGGLTFKQYNSEQNGERKGSEHPYFGNTLTKEPKEPPMLPPFFESVIGGPPR